MNMAAPATPDCAPPPTTPSAPQQRLPRHSCDTHLHVFGQPAHYPLDARRGYTPHVSLLADYRRVMATLGIERAVLVQPSVYGTDNRALLDALREGGPCFRGIAVPAADISDAQLADMHALGVRGIRLNLVNPAVLSVDAAVRLCARAEARGWHLQLQLVLDAANAGALQSLLQRIEVPLVIDHLGRVPPSDSLQPLLAALDTGRVWVKLSAPYRVSTLPAPHDDLASRIATLLAARPDRLLWGSDWPHTEQPATTPQAGDLVDLLHRWIPDPATRQRVLVDNPASLYGF
ncbi:amidohydrolase family protein [Variovorax sp. PAMC 28711]|uniref:amidohydrolase family protein n=1 Tax=Variovorax sp. PAMC 28711 TaxID=1795631 RepID=UPI00078C092C|nr:amidohydrolase family protein [Variovorax sp. PAMC 28711]AMM25175.1 hypothetical protein AX767_13000 [Variovorax sp. PAMC 28711]